MNQYQLLDSGDGEKLEQFGDFTFNRPSMAAVWKKTLSDKKWQEASGTFSRKEKENWTFNKKIPSSWILDVENIKMKISPTSFGHVGIFPEHLFLCNWASNRVKKTKNKPIKVLNLFAYTGMMSMFLAKSGAKVTHLDASSPTIAIAKENAKLNKLPIDSIRWIADDAVKFLKREIRRKSFYDGIILDPPSFGRGPKGEIFKIEDQIQLLLSLCKELLSKDALFLIFSCHTPGYSSIVCQNLLDQLFKSRKGKIESGETAIESEKSMTLPSGNFARWSND
jgi:23S rRNA (cytosine1962-C5)-methyltransferase